MKVSEHISLKDKNTLRIDGAARYFVETNDLQALSVFAKEKNLPIFVLGGGSNVLLPDEELNRVVLQLQVKGHEVIHEDEESLTISVGAAEHLDSFIKETVEKGYWGLENLSLIPGTVAGLAVQNVGAYGVEASSYIKSVNAFNTESGLYEYIPCADCSFGYRSSIFNTTKKGVHIIHSVTLVLSKIPTPILKYRGLQDFKENPTQQDIREKIIEIRKEKSLDPEEVWSAGSFFRNVEVEDLEKYTLSQDVKGKVFKTERGYKIPGAALIEDCELKGFCVGDACISDIQANMIINKGSATTKEIRELCKIVQEKVEAKTGVRLEVEPEVL
jgi:UDP-N-acetylmuramate dehydrogenase